MSEWRCLSRVSVLLTILLDLTHQGPHGSASSNSKLLMASYSIRSTVVSRYAHTLVTSVLSNPHDEAHEAIFDLDLPRVAFISNFTMTIGNKVYVAEIKEKHQAKKIYEKAYQQGNTAAHVGIRDRESEKFRISTRLAAGTEVTFALAYEELLQRYQGQYQLVVSLRPGQLVRKLNVEITVSERTGIAYVHIPPLRISPVYTNNQTSDGDLPPSSRIQRGETCVRITFSPTLQDQSAFSSSGIMADFTVHYDVVMEDIIGDVQVYGGYFIHYFAPRGLPPVEKNVVFVIDVSGSMFGTKLQQTKKAMNTILSDMQASDYFNIISFSDKVNIWKAEGSIQATVQNIHSAKNYLSRMEASGWTDINAALLAAASVLNHSNQEPGKGRGVEQIPLIMFLTDGEPTAGVTTPSAILSNIRRALGHRVSLFSLAFGDDADFSLLRRLSLENRGDARRIYEDSDAALQLEGFYEEISKPLLADVHLNYLGGLVGASPGTYFPNYFCGSELVVAGKVQPGEQELGIHLAARGPNGQLLVARHSEEVTNSSEKAFGCLGKPALNVPHFIRRLWAYVTIRELLEARFQARDTTTRRLLTAKALNLSLEYNFVTPLTSLVVVHLQKTNGESMSQLSTTPKTSTVTPSPSKSLGLGTGTAQPASVLRASSKSRPMKPTSAINAPKKKVPSSKELGKLGQCSNSLPTSVQPKPQTPAQDSSTLALPTLKMKPLAPVPSSSNVPLPLKPTTSSHQDPGVIPLVNSRTHVITLNPVSPAQPKGSTMKHFNPFPPSNLPAPSDAQPPPDAPSYPPPGEPISQPLQSRTQPKSISTFQTPKHPLLLSSKTLAPKSPPNLPHPISGIDLPKSPEIPSSLKPSASSHQTSTSLLLSKSRTPVPYHAQIPLPARPRPLVPESLSTFSNSLLSSTSPSSTVPTSIPRELLPSSFTPTLISPLPTERLWHQQDPLLGPKSTRQVLGPSLPGILIMAITNSSGPMLEASPQNLPILLPSRTLPETISLHLLPEKLQLLPESLVESKFVESLNPPVFYTFLTPDKDGSPHWDGNPERVLEGVERDMDSKSSVELVKGTLPGIFTFSSSVDGDPHFVVHIPHSGEKICFTLDGRPGDLLQLIEDPKAGLRVSGRLLGAPPRPGHEDQTRTYFQIITITSDKPRAYTITVSLSSISVQGEGTLNLPWDKPALVKKPQLELHVASATHLTLQLGPQLNFVILRHQYRHPSTLQLPHLGFYVASASGLSPSACGLIGQFQHTDIQLVTGPTGSYLRKHHGPGVPVVLGKKLLKESPRLHPRWTSCWLVKRSHVEQLLGQPYLAYVL
ncbi:LOW QUALITY PROTEIN: inter-alpha-trypsin inhibitor heavy chain H6 [Mesocricetus auratus]|uniref:LOW QUALITY PROTEIN: inter-alpha-trypsin inhibitor heavy chain H6 n=1 Tax=Mesocricetus auratus TaxID=10036 RepID=A0ABM2XAT6_MESAU|nr:LOW QUALITY PROTEIN: inter-alpha-trypsin inhibitor heavy chain H6 [Mesocricetus auratus]